MTQDQILESTLPMFYSERKELQEQLNLIILTTDRKWKIILLLES